MYNQTYSPSIKQNSQNGYSFCECNCCPYGYHIDLDFVRYCELIGQFESERSGSIKRRKDRRRQRQSMEVLLGITPPTSTIETSYKSIEEVEPPKKELKLNIKTANTQIQNTEFDDAVTDFERTLQRSKNKLSHNLPDVTAVSETIRRTVSNSSLSSASVSSMTVLQSTNEPPVQQDFDTVSIESYGLSPIALHTIREQMALSLERTKQLEDEVKIIPDLKVQLSSLKEENHRLLLRLKSEGTHKIISNFQECLDNNRSFSFNNLEDKKKPPTLPPRKDFGVMCGVLTRNVGVGHQNPNTKTVSTSTQNGELIHQNADKWYYEKVKFLNSQNSKPEVVKSTKATQTLPGKEKRDAMVQSVEIEKKQLRTVSNQASPYLKDFSQQKLVECYSVGCSEDTVNDNLCDSCASPKISVGVGPDSPKDTHTLPAAISLASLLVPRSKSFNLGEDKLNHCKNRTVACQHESQNISKGCQSSVKTHSKSCQNEVRSAEKNTQCESKSVSIKTDTKDLRTPTKSIACEAKEVKITSDIGCNTELIKEGLTVCSKCNSSKVEEQEEPVKKVGGTSPTVSRIPRRQCPTTPTESRKFRRQDTYTKIYSTSPPKRGSPTLPDLRLSGLDLSPKTISNETNPLDKVKENFKIPEVASTSTSAQNGVNSTITKVQVHETTLPRSETTTFQPFTSSTNRKKEIPSKEMQGALKVLNDSLIKSQTKNLNNHSAVNIVQQEWFKISSLVTANPLDVEDYLDAFEDMSSLLLEYIVNMSDASGNTAMHYAVSHGNFDVVSILLDSKVCDVNKLNKAGYTSVMLVSLAEMSSQTHANVVRRLFQLSDVNIRAKQHGQTALMLAVSHGRLDMVKMLLDADADINIQDEDGSTALMCAAEHGHLEIVKHFLSHPDCDSSITDVDGSTALKIAMEAGHRHIGVLLYAHDRNYHKALGSKLKKTKSASPKTPSSPLPIRSSHRALTDTKSQTPK